MVQPDRIRIHAADYFLLPEYAAHDLIQLIEGEVILGMPPVPRHQAIVGEVLFLLMTIARRSGGQVFTSPIEVYLDEHNVFEPDVLYLVPDSQCQITEKRLIGAPDLVVEVLSPGTAKFDRQEKYLAYEQHGVREYWIIDPLHEILEVWSQQSGQFSRHGVYAGEDTFNSPILRETISVREIFNPNSSG